MLGSGAIQLSFTAGGSVNRKTVQQRLIKQSVNILCGPATPLLGKCLPRNAPTDTSVPNTHTVISKEVKTQQQIN